MTHYALSWRELLMALYMDLRKNSQKDIDMHTLHKSIMLGFRTAVFIYTDANKPGSSVPDAYKAEYVYYCSNCRIDVEETRSTGYLCQSSNERTMKVVAFCRPIAGYDHIHSSCCQAMWLELRLHHTLTLYNMMYGYVWMDYIWAR